MKKSQYFIDQKENEQWGKNAEIDLAKSVSIVKPGNSKYLDTETTQPGTSETQK